jgi:hypothetical protein
VTLTSNQIDREQLDRYYVVITAEDGGKLKQTVVLTVNITDVNDNAPQFLRDEYESTLPENSTLFSRTVKVQVCELMFGRGVREGSKRLQFLK